MREWLLISAVTLALLVTGFTAGWLACAWRAERRKFDAQIEGYEKKLAGRYARQADRPGSRSAGADAAVPVAPVMADHRDRRVASDHTYPHPASPPGAAVGRRNRVPRDVVTAADLAPVFVPEPGVSVPFRPQPAPDPARDTMTLPRLLTDTGEMRAAGDLLIARMREDQAAWEASFHAECEADRIHRTEELAG